MYVTFLTLYFNPFLLHYFVILLKAAQGFFWFVYTRYQTREIIYNIAQHLRNLETELKLQFDLAEGTLNANVLGKP